MPATDRPAAGVPLVTVRLLGPVTVECGPAIIDVPGSKPRTVLALLAAAGGRVVATTALIDALWDGEPADGAEPTLRVHVSRLRKALAQALPAAVPPPVETLGSGYRLRLHSGVVDLAQFQQLHRQSASALRQGRAADAERASRQALDLWRGPALADLPPTRLLNELAEAWHEQRTATLEVHLDACLATGRAEDVVGELVGLVRADPLREGFTERLMLALYRTGRQAEALAAYAALQRRLDEELGLTVSTGLQQLHQRILQQDQSLAVATAAAAAEDSTDRTEREAPDGTMLGTVSVDGGPPIPIAREPWTIGRHATNDLILAGSKVSRRHAHIVTVQGRTVIVDLGSTNGTAVDGAAVTSHALDDGEEIRIGGHMLVFRAC